MGTFIRFIVQNIHFILFLILEIISINLAVNTDNRRKNIFLSTSNSFTGYFQQKIHRVVDYTSLGKENNRLSDENARLRQEILNLKQVQPSRSLNKDSVTIKIQDSLNIRYSVIPAQVISNSFTSPQNYITLDAGTLRGVKEGMGVISENGPAGIVVYAGKNYSKILSVYNVETAISAKVKRSKALGVVYWEPFNLEYVVMSEIPRHIELKLGDTVVTSGYSYSFPPNLPIGVVDHFNLESGENDYTVRLKLVDNLYGLSSCYVINDTWREELLHSRSNEIQ